MCGECQAKKQKKTLYTYVLPDVSSFGAQTLPGTQTLRSVQEKSCFLWSDHLNKTFHVFLLRIIKQCIHTMHFLLSSKMNLFLWKATCFVQFGFGPNGSWKLGNNKEISAVEIGYIFSGNKNTPHGILVSPEKRVPIPNPRCILPASFA